MKLHDFIPLTQAARVVGKCEQTLRWYCETGRLACHRDRYNRRYFELAELERVAKERGWNFKPEVLESEKVAW